MCMCICVACICLYVTRACVCIQARDAAGEFADLADEFGEQDHHMSSENITLHGRGAGGSREVGAGQQGVAGENELRAGEGRGGARRRVRVLVKTCVETRGVVSFFQM